jgi:hypothetical protein
MANPKHDPGLDVLLAHDGVILVVDSERRALGQDGRRVRRALAGAAARDQRLADPARGQRERLAATSMRAPSASEAGQGGA